MLRKFSCEGLQNSQYIGCQNHVLDLVLHLLIDYRCPTASKKTEIKYDFVVDVLIGYEKLHTKYDGLEIAPTETEKLKLEG